MSLKTDFKNDILDVSMDGKRRYRMIENSDGTVSFVDATTYTELGNNYGANEINEQNTAINKINTDLAQLREEVNMGKQLDYSNAVDIPLSSNKINFTVPNDGEIFYGNFFIRDANHTSDAYISINDTAVDSGQSHASGIEYFTNTSIRKVSKGDIVKTEQLETTLGYIFKFIPYK